MTLYKIYSEKAPLCSVEADYFDVSEDGRLNLGIFDVDCEPILVAVFNEWDFCVREENIKEMK